MEELLAELQRRVRELQDSEIRHLQQIRKLIDELDECTMDVQILTHVMDESTMEDDE